MICTARSSNPRIPSRRLAVTIGVDAIMEQVRSRVEYTLRVLPEETPLRGNVTAIDPETDAQNEARVRAELAAGSEWAWCAVVVTAHYQGFHGTDAIGCCSYDGEESFRRGGYYDDMREEALRRLAASLAEAVQTLETLGLVIVHVRRV
jgi:hypothetical protein